MQTRTLRRWASVHKWSSLVSTIFLLMLCITGLPLIFRAEIDSLLGRSRRCESRLGRRTPRSPKWSPPGHGRPGKFVQFLVWDRDEPGLIVLSMAKAPDAAPDNNKNVRVDARSADVLATARG